MADPSPERSWWTTLPGVLTGMAALLTAVTGLLALLVTFLQGRASTEPIDPRPPVVVPGPTIPPTPAPPGGRNATVSGAETSPTGPEPRPVPQRLPARSGGAPPLVLGERLEAAGTFFEVLDVENTPLRGGSEIRVTFRVTAGETKVTLDRSNVRILSRGELYRPVEGLPSSDIRAGATRQFWVRFEIKDALQDPVLSFTDDWIAPRGEVRRALTPG